ncbi:hypothetical protein A4H97_23670 [Niastella yeongjuensis]|uniref:Uncharacterized protein n=1 Tax=Niastella yeongjuensis TaxID=354355 RepID=A0A1V9F5A3_9BACT|nr:hypothetical protein A4H97_23670 [Niastella yeongjuensis]
MIRVKPGLLQAPGLFFISYFFKSSIKERFFDDLAVLYMKYANHTEEFAGNDWFAAGITM